MKMKAFLAVALVSMGCGAQVSVAELNASPRALSARSDLEVFSANTPSRQYVPVALISSRQATSAANRDAIISALKTTAEEYGCDGLILGSRTSKPVGVGDVAYLNGYDATCIVYKNAEAAAPTPIVSAPPSANMDPNTPSAASKNLPAKNPPTTTTSSSTTTPKASTPVATTPKASTPVATTPKASTPVATTPKTSQAQSPSPVADARSLLGAACGKKDGISCHRLGEDFELGKNGSKSLHEAVQAYNQSCTLGDTNDCRRATLLRKRL